MDDDADAVLVCAPAGFGKTSLLAHWARSTNPTAVAWADFGGRPRDKKQLWSAILTALEECADVPADSELRKLGRHGPDSATPAFIGAVIKALDALPVRVTLILHDLHDVVPQALEGLEALLDARPAGVRLVLCSRRDPPVSLAVLRSAGRLREVRADRLRFSTDETSAMLSRSGLCLGGAQVAEAQASTGGWPAGVRLLTAALRRQADPGGFLERMAASLQPLADFLVGEVLALLPAADRDLLEVLGAGGSVTAAAAARLSGRSDAYAALDLLAQETGLVYAESADRLRVQPLVSYRLSVGRRLPSVQAAELAGRALRRSNGRAADLLALARRAVRSGNTRVLRDIAERHAGILLVTNGPEALGQVLARLDEGTVASDPWLRVWSAVTRIEQGTTTMAGVAAADPPGSAARGRLVILRSITGLLAAASSGDLSVVPAAIDVERSRDDLPEWAALSLVAAAGRSMLVDANPAAAISGLKDALALARTHTFGYLELQCLGLLAGTSYIAGDYSAMTAAAAEADTAATLGGWETAQLSTAARWMLAYGALMRAEPVEAHRLAGGTLQRGGSALQPRYTFALRSVQGAALFDSGQRRRGLQKMRRARSDLGSVHVSRQEAAAPAVIEHRAATALGDARSADEVEAWLSERVGAQGEIHLMQAWSEQSAGRHGAAREMVRPVLDGTVTSLLPHTLLEALLVEATGWISSGDIGTARRTLGDALSSSAALGVVRPFVTIGSLTRDFLEHHLIPVGTTQPTAVRAVAAVLRPSRNQPSRPDLLDEGELRVLARLPSPSSVDEIAAQLSLSSTEVRSRIRGVYRKLGASSRRTAVVVAYECGLLR